MVANNAFMIKEMKEKVEKEGIEKERENSRLKDIGRVKNLFTKNLEFLMNTITTK